MSSLIENCLERLINPWIGRLNVETMLGLACSNILDEFRMWITALDELKQIVEGDYSVLERKREIRVPNQYLIHVWHVNDDLYVLGR